MGEQDDHEAPVAARGRGWRRIAAVVTAASGLGLLATTPGSAQTELAPGRGAARALVLRAGPSQAGLAVAVNAAESMADYQGSVGRGVSTSVVSGVLGLVAPDAVAYLPPPTRIDSTQDGSEEGRRETFPAAPAGSPVSLGASAQEVWADDDPRGTAATTLGAIDIPGVVSVGGGRSSASAGVVDRRHREASATVAVPVVELLGGQVRLESLRWRVTQRSGPGYPADVEEEGGFSIGRVVLAGQELAAPDTPAEIAAAFAQVNDAIAPTGLTLGVPTAGRRGATTTVSPLVVRMAGSDVGAAVFGPIFGAAQPARDAATAPLLEHAPEAAAAILVADIVVGALSGAGGVTFEIGGVEARTDGATYTNPLGSFRPSVGATPGRVAPAVPGAVTPAPVDRVAAAPVAPAVAAGVPGAAGAPTQLNEVPVAHDEPDAGPLGPLVAAGLLGTLALCGAEWARARRGRFSFDEVDR